MFDFMNMFGNYEDRKVDRYDSDNLTISTARVTDSSQPYETAVKHDDYNDADYIIVEMYNSKEEAQEGHNKWVKTMTTEPLPEELIDVSTCSLAEVGKAIGGWETVFKREKTY